MLFTQEGLFLLLPFVLFSLVACMDVKDYLVTAKVINGVKDKKITVVPIYSWTDLAPGNAGTKEPAQEIKAGEDFTLKAVIDPTYPTKLMPLRMLEVSIEGVVTPVAPQQKIDVHEKYAKDKGHVAIVTLKITSATDYELVKDNAFQAFVSFPLVFALLLGGLFY